MATKTPTPTQKLKALEPGKAVYIEPGNPKLGAKMLSDGRISLFLEYYKGYTMVYSNSKDKMIPRLDRTRETLDLYLATPRTPKDREDNKNTLELAHDIRIMRQSIIQVVSHMLPLLLSRFSRVRLYATPQTAAH